MEITLDSMFGIKDRVVVITGGSGAIGSNIGEIIAKLGARVALIDIDNKAVTGVSAELEKKTGSMVRGYSADITDEAQVKSTFAEIYKDFGSIYGLINAAGITYVEFLSRMDINRWQKVMDVNFRGTVLCTKYAGEYMAKNSAGRVINISSLAATHGKPGYTAYTPSKSAVDSFTFTLAAEWGHKGITVNSVRPVFMLSKITREQHGDKLAEVIKAAEERNPQARTCSPELLAGLIVFLLSESSSFVDGQLIGCDGGMTNGDIWAYKPED